MPGEEAQAVDGDQESCTLVHGHSGAEGYRSQQGRQSQGDHGAQSQRKILGDDDLCVRCDLQA